MRTRKANIHLKSMIDEAETDFYYTAEYRMKDNSHCIVFTDYTGNALTYVSIEANKKMMLLHRVGYITADMLFDPLTETIVKYDAQEMRHGFILQTKEYAQRRRNRFYLCSDKRRIRAD